jgi:hypothetical protein
MPAILVGHPTSFLLFFRLLLIHSLLFRFLVFFRHFCQNFVVLNAIIASWPFAALFRAENFPPLFTWPAGNRTVGPLAGQPSSAAAGKGSVHIIF